MPISNLEVEAGDLVCPLTTTSKKVWLWRAELASNDEFSISGMHEMTFSAIPRPLNSIGLVFFLINTVSSST